MRGGKHASRGKSAHRPKAGNTGPRFEGVVVRQDAKGCRVRLEDGSECWCPVRGSVHLSGTETTMTPIAVGDRVVVRREEGEEGSVDEVRPRRSVLARPDPHHAHLQRVLAANVDQVIIASSAFEPPFAPGFVDRVLVAAEWSRLDAVVVVTKADLAEGPPEELDLYRRLGHGVVVTSAARGDGIPEFRALLAGRASVILGHSGVGKSSLLNAVEPGLALAVGAVNSVSGRGRQTTTASVLVGLSGGGALVDTPGLREFALFNVPPRELTWLFRDLKEVAPSCRFKDCLHRGEPGCAIPAAVESGRLAAWRVDSYLRMLASTPDLKSWEVGR